MRTKYLQVSVGAVWGILRRSISEMPGNRRARGLIAPIKRIVRSWLTCAKPKA